VTEGTENILLARARIQLGTGIHHRHGDTEKSLEKLKKANSKKEATEVTEGTENILPARARVQLATGTHHRDTKTQRETLRQTDSKIEATEVSSSPCFLCVSVVKAGIFVPAGIGIAETKRTRAVGFDPRPPSKVGSWQVSGG
jgi:hypothetical protein